MKLALIFVSLLAAATYSSSAWVQAGEATAIKTIETTTTTNADGSTSTATATTKTNADGSTTTTKTNADGSTTKTNADGSMTTTTTDTNADGSTTTTVRDSAGSTLTTTTKTNPDGSVTTSLKFPDGYTTRTTTAKTTTVQIFSDGSSVVKQPDGKIVFYGSGEGPYALDFLLHATADDPLSPPTPSTPQWGGFLTPSMDFLDKSVQELIDQADNHSSGTPRPSAGTLATNPGYGTSVPPPLMPGNISIPWEIPPGGIPWEISPSSPWPMPPGGFPREIPPMKK